MRYNDKSGHWELWNEYRNEWIDLFTADTERALESVRIYMEMPDTARDMRFWAYRIELGI